ncbi:LPXTG cell wall anchor domain-containing protein [Actinoplanes sp. NPDC049681]|uniref:LPXTG cell wall anchor domain-containing protein n=1 Tax=Actinoplanes sp. NPDC049681 TaxID=3363905 RepID=UPI0037A6D942
MNLLKSPLRRTSAIAAGALIGLAGVAAFAAPASAHHPVVDGVSSCVNDDGTWQVTWEVANSEYDLIGKVTDVVLTPTDSTITGIVAEASLPVAGHGTLEGVQTLPASAESASITVTAEWQREQLITSTRGAEHPVPKPTEKCHPTPNPSNSKPAPQPSTPSDEPSTPSDEPSTPSEEPSHPSPSGSASKPPAPTKEPEFVYDQDCDTLTVGITVPADWSKDIEVTFTPSTGEAKTVLGKRGETTSVEFPASKGLKVKATPKGYEDEAATVTYKQPANCDSSGGGAGDEPSLPLTGAAAGSIAAGAGVLLAAGVALFYVARRRKVKFTA